MLCTCTEFQRDVLSLVHYNDKRFYHEILSEAICCCLQTMFVVAFNLIH